MSKLIVITAMTTDKLIGLNNDLPWKIPSDLAFFKEATTGKVIVVGRNTFESFGSRPLPNRLNIVFTRNITDADRELEVKYNDGEDRLLFMSDDDFKGFMLRNSGDVFIAGGAQIYKHFLDNYFVSEMLVSRVHAEYQQAKDESPIFFPDHEFSPNLWKCELIKQARKWQRGNERDSHDYDVYLYTKTLELAGGGDNAIILS